MESSAEDTVGEGETGSKSASACKEVTSSDSYNFNNNSFNPVMNMKFDIDKFDGSGDFGIWRRKERLFGFKMNPSKGIGQNLNEFKKMTIELTNAGEKEKLSDENEAIILLNSLPESFKDVKAAIKYGRTSLSLEECISALKSKELELKIERKDNGENLFVRVTVELDPIEDDRAAHSDSMHQVGESQNQPEITNPLADYELVRDRARRISKPNIWFRGIITFKQGSCLACPCLLGIFSVIADKV
ncbi:hypothetical protein EZV62_010249 [Acer yangbiense]|uniref:Uncharacterized protein n=1 Tax=Acer yangbiense TaxID=1000413 RepID=A0A5C7I2F6_9ROSI|nr:hypothetical protein EZV62_010249 [Acer yangbiense]